MTGHDQETMESLRARVAELEAERFAAHTAADGYAGDLAAIVRMMNRLDYPHHPEYPNDDEIIRRICEMGGKYMTAKEDVAALRAELAELRGLVREALAYIERGTLRSGSTSLIARLDAAAGEANP